MFLALSSLLPQISVFRLSGRTLSRSASRPSSISLYTRYPSILNSRRTHKFHIYFLYLQGLNPFFLFQAYTVILWTLQWYWKFALIIAVTTVITVTLSVWETRKVGPVGREGEFSGEIYFISSSKTENCATQ